MSRLLDLLTRMVEAYEMQAKAQAAAARSQAELNVSSRVGNALYLLGRLRPRDGEAQSAYDAYDAKETTWLQTNLGEGVKARLLERAVADVEDWLTRGGP